MRTRPSGPRVTRSCATAGRRMYLRSASRPCSSRPPARVAACNVNPSSATHSGRSNTIARCLRGSAPRRHSGPAGGVAPEIADAARRVRPARSLASPSSASSPSPSARRPRRRRYFVIRSRVRSTTSATSRVDRCTSGGVAACGESCARSGRSGERRRTDEQYAAILAFDLKANGVDLGGKKVARLRDAEALLQVNAQVVRRIRDAEAVDERVDEGLAFTSASGVVQRPASRSGTSSRQGPTRDPDPSPSVRAVAYSRTSKESRSRNSRQVVDNLCLAWQVKGWGRRCLCAFSCSPVGEVRRDSIHRMARCRVDRARGNPRSGGLCRGRFE